MTERYFLDEQNLRAVGMHEPNIFTFRALAELLNLIGRVDDAEESLGQKQPLDADLTAIAALATTAAGRSVLTFADPNADKILFWDDSAGAVGLLEPAANLAITGTDLDASNPAAAGAWSLTASWVFSVNVANVDFTGLAGATDILVVARNVTLSVSGTILLRVSTNNGSTFFATSGDYVIVPDNGIEAASTAVGLNGTAATAARSGVGLIKAANVTGAPRVIETTNRTDQMRLFVADTANDIDAVRIIPSAGGNLTGGAVYIFTR